MQYRLAIDPQLELSAAEFVAVWNASPQAQNAPASLTEATREAFLTPEITVALITAAVSIPATVIATVVSEYLKKKLIEKDAPKVTVTTIATPDGQPLLIIKKQRPNRDDTEYKNNPHPSLRATLPRFGGGLGRGVTFKEDLSQRGPPMPTSIIIREVAHPGVDFTATVQFDSADQHPITVTNPFTDPADERRLEWYFEEWLDFPFIEKVKAAEAAASVRAYGEALFEQVFRRNPDIYVEYRQLRAADIRLEIIGSPEFHALHWEALHDPNDERPLAVDALVVRKNLNPVHKRAELKPAPHLRVLLVTARPAGRRDVSYRTISRPLVEALETAKVAAHIDMVRPGTFEALVDHLESARDAHGGDGYYHLIHLDMHGALLTYEQYQRIDKQQLLADKQHVPDKQSAPHW